MMKIIKTRKPLRKWLQTLEFPLQLTGLDGGPVNLEKFEALIGDEDAECLIELSLAIRPSQRRPDDAVIYEGQ